MTKNQIEYRKALETERANKAAEEIKQREADIKQGSLELESALAEYNRYGSGPIANIARLIQAYGNDTGIDDDIKGEARRVNQNAASSLHNLFDSLTNHGGKDSTSSRIRNIFKLIL